MISKPQIDKSACFTILNAEYKWTEEDLVAPSFQQSAPDDLVFAYHVWRLFNRHKLT